METTIMGYIGIILGLYKGGGHIRIPGLGSAAETPAGVHAEEEELASLDLTRLAASACIRPQRCSVDN